MGCDFDYEILSVLRWVRRELVADRYGTDRVFIAGDAAHLMSPTGGFGMNTGIQDSVDLGWKLEARCAAGPAGDLLRSYEIERRPVAIRNVTEASGNLGRMLSTRQRRPPPEIFEPGAAGDAARKEYGAWFTETMKREWYTLGIHLGYRYDASPIVWPDGTPAPPLEIATYTQTARPGARAPHAWLPDGRSTLDLFGRGFTLLRVGRGCAANEGPARRGGASVRAVARGRDRSTAHHRALCVPARRWFVPTDTWRGAPMPSRRTRARSSTSCAAKPEVGRQWPATSRLPSTPVISSDDDR